MLSARALRLQARQFLSPVPTAHPFKPASALRLRTRAFHATPPRQDALDAFLYVPHEMMSLIHMALPWYATLPLTAFIIRGFLVTTAGSWARSLTARYIGLHPLRHAIALQKRHELMKTKQFSNPGEAIAAIRKEVKAETSKLDKKWSCTLWGQVNWTFAQLPLFVAMAEVLRQMCNTKDGLLAVALKTVGLQPGGESVHGVSMAVNQWFEPSLANGGMLWFPDLLAADPTGALPFVTSALMFTNVFITKNTTANHHKIPRTSKVIRRTLLGFSLLIGPLCQDLPAALMLYWASSTTSVMLWNVWLDHKYPAPRGFMPCSRPLQTLPIPKLRRG